MTPTFYGQTARLIAHFRPKMPIYGVSPHDRAMRRMQLYWGVYPLQGHDGRVFHQDYEKFPKSPEGKRKSKEGRSGCLYCR
ncbi:MAG: pyruvate kinase alpha/beta domain-containing protein [Lachnospiraceae bacterium]